MSVKAMELLAPAGDFQKLEAALLYGANAVYFGSDRFTMRTAPKNFTGEQLRRAVELSHRHGAQAYLTCNTLPRVHEVDALEPFLHEAQEAGMDAVIVADVGALCLCRRAVPGLPVHISTQAGVVNDLTARTLHELGASRVVLARELSLEEIRAIRERTPPALELECFVHGAMCMSFSGRCLISNYLTGRDGNRGECAQPCRWSYHLVEEKRPGEYYPIVEGDDGTYLLNARDLCMIEHLDKLAEAGVTSLKIEGRAKSAYYVGAVTSAYRAALDSLTAYDPSDPAPWSPPAWAVEETCKVRRRSYCTGFYFGPPDNGQLAQDGGFIQEWEIAAVVEDYADGRLRLSQRNRFACGETLEVLEPGAPPTPFEVRALFDGEGHPIEVARHPLMELLVPSSRAYPPGAMLRRRIDLPAMREGGVDG